MKNYVLEEEALKFKNEFLEEHEDGIDRFDIEDIFIAGAEWQYEQFEKNRLTACDNMTEEAAEREQRFAVNFIAENNRIPTFSDAIEYGRKTMREKAISRLENLCKEWHLHESTEAKYRMEVYDELLEMLKEGKK